jgi:hypothetical protein
LLLDIDSIPWPAGLRAVMQMFNGLFNINCPPPHPATPDQLVNTLTNFCPSW